MLLCIYNIDISSQIRYSLCEVNMVNNCMFRWFEIANIDRYVLLLYTECQRHEGIANFGSVQMLE